MRILHISTFERTGGAAIAATRLHRGLRGLGHDSSLLVRDRSAVGDAEGTVGLAELSCATITDPALSQVLYAAYRDSRAAGVDRQFSPDLPTLDFASLPLVQDADIVNLHWTSGMLSVAGARAIQNLDKPVVWTLHDQATFTGGCHYSGPCRQYASTCGGCPYLEPEARHVPALLLRHKAQWLDTSRLTVVCPSQWLSDCARESTLLRGARIETIANSVPVDLYQRVPRHEARALLGLPEDVVILLIGADRLDEARKGYAHLCGAMERLAVDPRMRERMKAGTLVCAAFGDGDLPDLGVPMFRLGRLSGDEQVALAYRAANIFVLPTLEDNLPNTLLESVAAGTPVVAYHTGGIADVLADGCGIAVDRGDIAGLAAALGSLVDDTSARQTASLRCEAFARASLDLPVQGRAYLRVYQSLLESAASERPTTTAPANPDAPSFLAELSKSERELFEGVVSSPLLAARLFGGLTRELTSHQELIAARGGEIVALQSEIHTVHDQWRTSREALHQTEQYLHQTEQSLHEMTIERATLRKRLRRFMTQVVILGSGDEGRRIWEAVSSCGTAEVVGFVDTDSLRHGRTLLGVGIHPLEWLKTATWDILAVAGDASVAGRDQVKGIDVDDGRILVFPWDKDDAALADVASTRFPDPLARAFTCLPPRAYTRVGIFGTGTAAMKVWEALAEIDQADAICFADNNPQQQGRTFLWLDVIDPAQLPERGLDVVIVGSMSRDPIRRQLCALGIAPDRILTPDVVAPVDEIRKQLVVALARQDRRAELMR